MHMKWKIFLMATLLLSMPGHATMVVSNHIDSPQLIGEARLKVMLWNVFDAKLYSPSGSYSENEPFALSLTYLRSLDGQKIVAKSMEEIRRQGHVGSSEQYADWQTSLSRIIPDVSKGTTLTGIRSMQGHTLFYLGDKAIGTIEDPAFTQAFFNIWLGENTSDRALRNQLLGFSTTS